MSLMKALIPSTILTLIVAAIVGPNGDGGNILTLESASIGHHTFFWSWPFFMLVMALNCVLITRISKEVNA